MLPSTDPTTGRAPRSVTTGQGKDAMIPHSADRPAGGSRQGRAGGIMADYTNTRPLKGPIL
jgi:hypothetical protein